GRRRLTWAAPLRRSPTRPRRRADAAEGLTLGASRSYIPSYTILAVLRRRPAASPQAARGLEAPNVRRREHDRRCDDDVARVHAPFAPAAAGKEKPMLRNRIRTLVFLVTLVGLLAPGWVAAQSNPVQGGSLRVAITGDPPTLDPHTSTAVIVLEITSHVAEGLYARDGEGAVRPMLAEALPEVSDDGLTYTIRLRQGVTFHDGQV